jgi:hypothetical protein
MEIIMGTLKNRFAPAALAAVTVATAYAQPTLAQGDNGRAPQARPALMEQAMVVKTSFAVPSNAEVSGQRLTKHKPLYPGINSPEAAFFSGLVNRFLSTDFVSRAEATVFRMLGNDHAAKMQDAMRVCAHDDIRNAGLTGAYKAGSLVGAVASLFGPPSFTTSWANTAIAVGFELAPEIAPGIDGRTRGAAYAGLKLYQHAGTYQNLPGSLVTYSGPRNLLWDAARLLVLADGHKPVKCTPQIREEARAHLKKLSRSYVPFNKAFDAGQN